MWIAGRIFAVIAFFSFRALLNAADANAAIEKSTYVGATDENASIVDVSISNCDENWIG